MNSHDSKEHSSIEQSDSPHRFGGPPGSGVSLLGTVTVPMSSSPPPTRRKHLVLCLSGGGFRATLFHLGLIRYLAQTKELQRVTDIFAVSGGSILAAHLAQRWGDYTGGEESFENAAMELRTLTARDIRGRIVRRWLLAGACAVPLLLRRFQRDQLLVREYAKFFERDGRDTELRALHPRGGPNIHLLTTSMTTGKLCEFTSAGFQRLNDPAFGEPVTSPRFTIPLAVAASSAFPPLFPPLKINTEYFGLPRNIVGVDFDYLSDGGVFDNLGLMAATKSLAKGLVPDADFLVSDASASFKWKTRGNGFWNIVGRTTRTTDILMKRVADLEVDVHRAIIAAVEQAAEHRGPTELDRILLPRIGVVHINGAVDAMAYRQGRIGFNAFEAKWFYPPLPQASPSNESAAIAIAAIRTDLDAFDSTECRVLEAWGFAQGLKSWFVARQEPGPPGSESQLVAPEICAADVTAIERSSRRKLRIIAFNDPIGVLFLVMWLALIVLLTGLLSR